MEKLKLLAQNRGDNQAALAEKLKEDLSVVRNQSRPIYADVVENVGLQQNDENISNGEETAENAKVDNSEPLQEIPYFIRILDLTFFFY